MDAGAFPASVRELGGPEETEQLTQTINDDVDDFIRRVANQLDTTPDQARSQLPAGYGPLFD